MEGRNSFLSSSLPHPPLLLSSLQLHPISPLLSSSYLLSQGIFLQMHLLTLHKSWKHYYMALFLLALSLSLKGESSLVFLGRGTRWNEFWDFFLQESHQHAWHCFDCDINPHNAPWEVKVYVPFPYILLHECLGDKDLEFYIKLKFFLVSLINVFGFKYSKSETTTPWRNIKFCF